MVPFASNCRHAATLSENRLRWDGGDRHEYLSHAQSCWNLPGGYFFIGKQACVCACAQVYMHMYRARDDMKIIGIKSEMEFKLAVLK